MDARHSNSVRLLSAQLAACLVLVVAGIASGQQSFQVTTRNFHVVAPDRSLAQQVAEQAEVFRRDLALDWLGHELPNWREKCPIRVELGPHAGGETTFAFASAHERTEPFGWQMKIFGPPNRIVDSVLPHEITHTIFATHFGRPVPRWADEGACTTVEHEVEIQKSNKMLIDFLTAKPSRGIPFNQMFLMKQYPHDILPLYAQGHSLARFLIMQKGRQHFIKYLGTGMSLEGRGNDLATWGQATQQYYGYRDLSDLQIAWMDWVRLGSQDIRPGTGPEIIAAASAQQVPVALAPAPTARGEQIAATSNSLSGGESWYRRQMKLAQSGTPAGASDDSAQPASEAAIPVQFTEGGYLPGSLAGLPEDIKQLENRTGRAPSPPSGSERTVWR